MKNFFKNLFKMPLATYKCSTVWIIAIFSLLLSGGITTIATQLNTTVDRFDIVETRTGSIIGDIGSRSSVGLENGFTQEGLKIWKLDASAPSGSRFTEITNFNSEIITSGDAGDRLYFSGPQGIKTWAIKTLCTVAKTSTEKYIAKYYSINADDLIPVDWMSMNDTCIRQNSKNLWRITNEQYITLNEQIDSDWLGTDNILDKIPNTGESRYWLILEVPPGGISTPPRITNIMYRSNGIARLKCNWDVFFGISRVRVSQKIPAIDFWDGGIPNTATLNITSTAIQTVHKLRNALGDSIHGPYSFPFGIDTSTPITIALSYSSSTAINTADIQIDLYTASHINGTIGVGVTSDRIITRNIVIPSAGKVGSVILIDDYSIDDFLEADIMFIQITRTDSNGGDFYPIEFFINYNIFKIGKSQ